MRLAVIALFGLGCGRALPTLGDPPTCEEAVTAWQALVAYRNEDPKPVMPAVAFLTTPTALVRCDEQALSRAVEASIELLEDDRTIEVSQADDLGDTRVRDAAIEVLERVSAMSFGHPRRPGMFERSNAPSTTEVVGAWERWWARTKRIDGRDIAARLAAEEEAVRDRVRHAQVRVVEVVARPPQTTTAVAQARANVAYRWTHGDVLPLAQLVQRGAAPIPRRLANELLEGAAFEAWRRIPQLRITVVDDEVAVAISIDEPPRQHPMIAGLEAEAAAADLIALRDRSDAVVVGDRISSSNVRDGWMIQTRPWRWLKGTPGARFVNLLLDRRMASSASSKIVSGAQNRVILFLRETPGPADAVPGAVFYTFTDALHSAVFATEERMSSLDLSSR